MRLTPSQIAVLLISGRKLPKFRAHDEAIQRRIKRGHDMLVAITGKDFGYDLQAWHDHLKESREGGYTYGRNILLPKIMRAAIESQEWQNAIESLEVS